MDRILKILELIKKDGDFRNSKNFIEDGLLDSLDIFELIDSLEKEFHIEFKGKDIVPENFDSCKSIMNLIDSYKER